MKINMHLIKETDISDFADMHNLTMGVYERGLSMPNLPRFYAHFEDVEVSDGCILKSIIGNGDCPDQAILEYAHAIQLKVLVFDAYGPNRKEILVPKLVYNPKKKD